MIEASLVLLTRKNKNKRQICLGLKLNGFAEGLWNGFGGKLEHSENPEESAVRELEEEIGVSIKAGDLEKVGEVFYHESDNDWKTHVYLLKDLNQKPIETYEVRPQWFYLNEIPYEDMWENDKLWLPKILSGKKIKGEVWHNSENEIEKHFFKEVEDFSDSD